MIDAMNRILTYVAIAFAVVSCGGSPVTGTLAEVQDTYEVNGVAFTMKTLEPGAVSIGTRKDGVSIVSDRMHRIALLDGFAISEMPVSPDLWKAVTGKVMEKPSYNDCEKFVAALSKKTGVPFIIPTEAMWEYACKSGEIVVDKSAFEWCSDSFSDSYPYDVELNPAGSAAGDLKVVRKYDKRQSLAGYTKSPATKFRVAVLTGKPCPEALVHAMRGESVEKESGAGNCKFEVGGVKFAMVAVDGSDFSIGQTEVTAGLWNAVMGYLPLANYMEDSEKPVINVTWYDAQLFIWKLNQLTGRKFRLPTVEEWETAAKGGSRSRGYEYAGGKYIWTVAVFNGNSPNDKVRVVKVKTMSPNELGIYDMSGNAWEWCADCSLKGGSAASKSESCKIAYKGNSAPGHGGSTYGFRLAL